MRTKTIRGLAALIKVLSSIAAVTAYFNPEVLPAKYILPALIIVALCSASKDFLITLCDILDDGKRNNSFDVSKLSLVLLLCCCVSLVSCAQDAAAKAREAQLLGAVLDIAASAGEGYLNGGKAGAGVAALQAGVRDARALAKTAAKQPVDVTPKP